MIITEFTTGDKVPYKLTGTVLLMGQGENTLEIDIANRQKDVEICIDIRQDAAGTITEDKGQAYVANIKIPAKIYEIVDTGIKNEKDEEIYKRQALDIDMEAVELVLWPLSHSLINKITSTENKGE